MKDHEILNQLEAITVDGLKAITKKGELSEPDLKKAKDAICLLSMLDGLRNMEPLMDGENGYSMRGAWGVYPIHGGMDWGYHDRMSHDEMWDGNSNARGRSPMTGRYVSRDSGYSGHSINDRMIDNLEKMMSQANSDYERQQIENEIRRIRMGER